MVERLAVNQDVTGSSPVAGAIRLGVPVHASLMASRLRAN